MHRMIVFLLSAFVIAPAALTQGLAGNWIGQMNGGFKVRIHFEKAGSGFTGKLINPSGNETALERITADGTHLHFAVKKFSLSYDGVWNDQQKAWKGNLTFQLVYPLDLKRASFTGARRRSQFLPDLRLICSGMSVSQISLPTANSPAR